MLLVFDPTEHPWDSPGHQGHAHPQGQQIPEGRGRQAPVRPFPSLQRRRWQVCPGGFKLFAYETGLERVPCGDDYLRTPLDERWNYSFVWAPCEDRLTLLLTQKWLFTLVFVPLRPNSLAGLRDVGPRRVPSSFYTCLKMLRATLSWRYDKVLILIFTQSISCWTLILRG